MKAWFLPLVAGCLAILPASFAQSPAPSAVPEETAAKASPSPEDLSKYRTADDLWARIKELEQGPATPPSSPAAVVPLIRQIYTALVEFQTRYPKDPRHWEAKLLGLRFDSILAHIESREPDPTEVEAALNAIAGAPDAANNVKAEARLNLIGIHAAASGQETLTPEVEKEMLAFIHDFPDDPNDAQLQSARLQSLQKTDPAQAAKLLDSLLQDPNPQVVRMAQTQARLRDLMKKPLDLKFTATDGSTVDVGKLRGKVVLIDFWATWCGPCMAEAPNVVEAYNDLHGKGLEIVGISLDQDKGRLDAVTKVKGMVWPQYFDGKGWENAISSSYGITSIPSMWLVDKKGMIVDSDARDGLKEKIEKLLAE
jgi:thiol-disulfide isomerase/thioredoxin